MDVLVTGVKPGKIVEDIACYVENAEEPVRLHVEADIKVRRFIFLIKLNKFEF
jgi:hypothetical protein